MNTDPPTKAVAHLIANLGYAVTIQETQEIQATATDHRMGSFDNLDM